MKQVELNDDFDDDGDPFDGHPIILEEIDEEPDIRRFMPGHQDKFEEEQ